jgi:AraC-like DNA-binding protein
VFARPAQTSHDAAAARRRHRQRAGTRPSQRRQPVGIDRMGTRRRSCRRRPGHREQTVQALAELYLQAQKVVERHYRGALTLPAVARALAVSPRQLQRAYDEVGLTTFAAELRAVRLRNAAELLARQPLTVTDVARLVGYRQPSHFVKAFKRRYGTTPGAFRDRRAGPTPTRGPRNRPRHVLSGRTRSGGHARLLA